MGSRFLDHCLYFLELYDHILRRRLPRRDAQHGAAEARLRNRDCRRRERLERADDGRNEEQSDNDKARDDAADRVNRAPYRAFRGWWRRRFGVSSALSWRGQSVQVNVRERRADEEDGDANGRRGQELNCPA